MKHFFLRQAAELEDGEGLRASILEDNLRRGRLLCVIVIAIEACFASIDIAACLMKADSRFHFSVYLAMYLLMIAANFVFLHFISTVRKDTRTHVARDSRIVTGYITLAMCWGSVVALMDQALYGNLAAFMVNMITFSVLYYQNGRESLVPYLSSTVILLVGLPLFQRSGDVLVGHYANLAVFIVVSWTASRIVYARFCSDYQSRMRLLEANRRLTQQIEQNAEMNTRLEQVNLRLKQQTLVDELTGIPNRRSFRNFIDRMFMENPREHLLFSVAMIDLDCFKEYNDHYGHTRGDEVLLAVANQIQSVVLHDTDIAARWGGEEFVYATYGPGTADIGSTAEIIGYRVLQLRIPHAYSTAGSVLSCSIGVATVEVRGRSDISRCIELADKAMYVAKTKGRNRIERL